MEKLSSEMMTIVSIATLDYVKHGLSVPSTCPVLPPPSVAEVILNVTSYNVTEGGENPIVCAEIQNPDPDTVLCPLDFELSVTFNSLRDTAGVKQINFEIIGVSIVCLFLYRCQL